MTSWRTVNTRRRNRAWRLANLRRLLKSSLWCGASFLGLEEVEAPSLTNPPCVRCEGHGWVETWSERPPAVAVCPVCFNPDDNPHP